MQDNYQVTFENQNITGDNQKTNLLMLASNDDNVGDNDSLLFFSIDDVKNYYATSTATYKFCEAFFNNGNLSGQCINLIKIPGTTNSTQGKWVSTDVSANLATLLAKTDGSMTIDGVNIANIHLKNKKTWKGVADAIMQKLPASILNYEIVAKSDDTGLEITNTTFGSDSTVVIAAGTTGTDITQYLDISNASYTAGINGTLSPEFQTRFETYINQYPQCTFATTFPVREEDAITIAQLVKTNATKRPMKYVYPINIGNPQVALLKTELGQNKYFDVISTMTSDSNNTGEVEMLYCAKICASGLSQDVMDQPDNYHIQLTLKDIDPLGKIKSRLAGWSVFNSFEQQQKIKEYLEAGIGVYGPTNGGDLWVFNIKPRTIDGAKYHFSNDIMRYQLISKIKKELAKYINEANLAEDADSRLAINVHILSSCLEPLASPSKNAIKPFSSVKGKLTEIPRYSSSPDESLQMQNDIFNKGYAMCLKYTEGNAKYTHVVVISTAFGITEVKVDGVNLTKA
jgi:hypothetical protein